MAGKKDEHYAGLQNWVGAYKQQRSAGNVKDARQTKQNIDAQIVKHGLDAGRVYGADPDAPKQRKYVEVGKEPARHAANAAAKNGWAKWDAEHKGKK